MTNLTLTLGSTSMREACNHGINRDNDDDVCLALTLIISYCARLCIICLSVITCYYYRRYSSSPLSRTAASTTSESSCPSLSLGTSSTATNTRTKTAGSRTPCASYLSVLRVSDDDDDDDDMSVVMMMMSCRL